MGCDAHFFLEKRIGRGKWHLDPSHRFAGTEPLEIPSLSGRSYQFFGIVAGVRERNVKRPIAEGRGLPADVSKVLEDFFKDDSYGFHSPTHLSPKELERALKRYNTFIKKMDKSNINLFDAPADTAFLYQDIYRSDCRISGAIINYIRSNLDWERAENLLIGAKNKTEYRIVVWFDS